MRVTLVRGALVVRVVVVRVPSSSSVLRCSDSLVRGGRVLRVVVVSEVVVSSGLMSLVIGGLVLVIVPVVVDVPDFAVESVVLADEDGGM